MGHGCKRSQWRTGSGPFVFCTTSCDDPPRELTGQSRCQITFIRLSTPEPWNLLRPSYPCGLLLWIVSRLLDGLNISYSCQTRDSPSVKSRVPFPQTHFQRCSCQHCRSWPLLLPVCYLYHLLMLWTLHKQPSVLPTSLSTYLVGQICRTNFRPNHLRSSSTPLAEEFRKLPCTTTCAENCCTIIISQLSPAPWSPACRRKWTSAYPRLPLGT